MPLSDAKCKNAKPREDGKRLRLSDEKGMYLEVMPNGAKYWRLKYRFAGKEKRLALGVYPDVTLGDARKKRDEARRLLGEDIDPGIHRKVQKAARAIQAENSFEAVAREWFAKYKPSWVDSHADKIIRRLERDIFPWLGKRPIAEIEAPELLAVLRRIEHRGAIETAHRAMQNCGQVFRYAVATGRAKRNSAADLVGALSPVIKTSFATITEPEKIAQLLRAMDGYQGSFITQCALKLAPLVFVRPGELRKAEWSEIDFEAEQWVIPAERMKMREKHIVPLSRQALAILKELEALTGSGQYIFPGARTNGRPMSENTVNAALRRLGYAKDDMTGHGFRHMASTLLNEQGWNRDAIERQMAHGERNSIRATYNYAEYLPERARMMQSWSDYLDGLKAGAKVTPLFKTA
ncbi:tyrosine-type recombinase/integrase [Chromobacterium paludis]|uniref:Tyrosine-type recombinase/integrase n=1 Tax=Chromobacterium paludis TaxID=2605945 RepID=A0A5C1DEB7_9NEIS|nr:tyrosine-type recombinase/integrase [Chromobacterium paludis]QEL55132.1 tyrosine-type recombinase/integrase [Chromobacterium paludis]